MELRRARDMRDITVPMGTFSTAVSHRKAAALPAGWLELIQGFVKKGEVSEPDLLSMSQAGAAWLVVLLN